MKTASDIIRDSLDRFIENLNHLKKSSAREILETELNSSFGWHPIERADVFGFRTVPKGKMWGPRLVAIVEGENVSASPHIVFWDPDTVQPDGRPVALPEPYWRTVGMTAGWSRRNQPTHFIRPYAPHFER